MQVRLKDYQSLMPCARVGEVFLNPCIKRMISAGTVKAILNTQPYLKMSHLRIYLINRTTIMIKVVLTPEIDKLEKL